MFCLFNYFKNVSLSFKNTLVIPNIHKILILSKENSRILVNNLTFDSNIILINLIIFEITQSELIFKNSQLENAIFNTTSLFKIIDSSANIINCIFK